MRTPKFFAQATPFLVICLVLIATPLYADELVSSENIKFHDKTYTLTSKFRIGDRIFSRLTLPNETKDAFTSMVILQYEPNNLLRDWDLAKDVRAYMEDLKPKPFYNITSIGGAFIARSLTRPGDDVKELESSVMRIYPATCGGQVVFQFIMKIDASSDEAKTAWGRNDMLATEIATKLQWQPACISGMEAK